MFSRHQWINAFVNKSFSTLIQLFYQVKLPTYFQLKPIFTQDNFSMITIDWVSNVLIADKKYIEYRIASQDNIICLYGLEFIPSFMC